MRARVTARELKALAALGEQLPGGSQPSVAPVPGRPALFWTLWAPAHIGAHECVNACACTPHTRVHAHKQNK